MISITVSSPKTTIDELNDDINKFIGGFTNKLQRNLKRETPKLTGRASRGWTKSQDDTVSNTVPYINRLDEGWSKQKPRGFVKQTIRKTIRQTKRTIR
tara:strand:- start:922 stop:1215 length:294 start_codon:yes stop_codon:yes gene_type:complete